jgi:hypothetical protein
LHLCGTSATALFNTETGTINLKKAGSIMTNIKQLKFKMGALIHLTCGMVPRYAGYKRELETDE